MGNHASSCLGKAYKNGYKPSSRSTSESEAGCKFSPCKLHHYLGLTWPHDLSWLSESEVYDGVKNCSQFLGNDVGSGPVVIVRSDRIPFFPRHVMTTCPSRRCLLDIHIWASKSNTLVKTTSTTRYCPKGNSSWLKRALLFKNQWRQSLRQSARRVSGLRQLHAARTASQFHGWWRRLLQGASKTTWASSSLRQSLNEKFQGEHARYWTLTKY